MNKKLTTNRKKSVKAKGSTVNPFDYAIIDGHKMSEVNNRKSEEDIYANEVPPVGIPPVIDDAIDKFAAYENNSRTLHGIEDRQKKLTLASAMIEDIIDRGGYTNLANKDQNIYKKKLKELNLYNALHDTTRGIGTTDGPIGSITVIEDYQNYTYGRLIQTGLDLMDNIITDPVQNAIKKEYSIYVDTATKKQYDHLH